MNITKNALAGALKDLMRQKPFEKISVSDICEQCGLGRKSFYYHFKDKYDLVNWIFYVDFIGKMDIAAYDNGWDLIRDLCEHFYADKQFYRAALAIEGQNSFHDYILETFRPIMALSIRELYPDIREQSFFADFFGDAFLAAIMRWLSDGMTMEPAELVDNLQRISVALASNILKKQ